MHLGVGGLLDSLCLDTHTPERTRCQRNKAKEMPCNRGHNTTEEVLQVLNSH